MPRDAFGQDEGGFTGDATEPGEGEQEADREGERQAEAEAAEKEAENTLDFCRSNA